MSILSHNVCCMSPSSGCCSVLSSISLPLYTCRSWSSQTHFSCQVRSRAMAAVLAQFGIYVTSSRNMTVVVSSTTSTSWTVHSPRSLKAIPLPVANVVELKLPVLATKTRFLLSTSPSLLVQENSIVQSSKGVLPSATTSGREHPPNAASRSKVCAPFVGVRVAAEASLTSLVMKLPMQLGLLGKPASTSGISVALTTRRSV